MAIGQTGHGNSLLKEKPNDRSVSGAIAQARSDQGADRPPLTRS
jgi:hypothetical protein